MRADSAEAIRNLGNRFPQNQRNQWGTVVALANRSKISMLQARFRREVNSNSKGRRHRDIVERLIAETLLGQRTVSQHTEMP